MCPPPAPSEAAGDDAPQPGVIPDSASPNPGEPYTEELAPGVHAYIQPDGGWCLNNAGWVTDGRSTLLIDTAATERRARRLRESLLAGGAPLPTTLVNTHHHGDHSYGNFVFAPQATVVAHDACRDEAIEAGYQLHTLWPETDFGDITLSAPSRTFSDELKLEVGELEVRLLHPGVAHTRGDTIVWLPEHSVVFAGDLVFHGGTPFVPMGSLSGSLRALDRLRELGARTVVPGHGPLAGPEVYDTVERYLRYVDGLAREGFAGGRTPLEVAREAVLDQSDGQGGFGEFASLAESERLVANLHRAYAELAGRPLGDPLDLPAVWGDMMELNGGEPIACHA